jgi:hypothetical protein
VLEATFVAHVVRPFSTHRVTEIVSAPKVYGFDTGFMCYHRGWHVLRREDMGLLWEHFVLNELHAQLQFREVRYWRDKHGHEVDFILVQRGNRPVTVECKWSAEEFDTANVRAFRKQYPKGENFVVAKDVKQPYTHRYGEVPVRFVGLTEFIDILLKGKWGM